MIIVSKLPDANLEKATHLEMKKKLAGLTLEVYNDVSDATEIITIDASYSRPEEWLKTREVPSVNINSMSGGFDPTRFTTAKMYAYEDASKSVLLEKQYMTPVVYFYEVRFIVALGQHMMSLNEQIQRKLPKMGFGSYLKVPYGDDFIICPFELIDEKEMFARYGETEDNREFEKVFRYKLEGWLDTHPTERTTTVQSVKLQIGGLKTDTSAPSTPGTTPPVTIQEIGL